MDETLGFLTLIGQQAAVALNIPNPTWWAFDDLFLRIQEAEGDDAAEVLVLLYNFTNAYSGYAHLRRMYSLKHNHTAAETAQLNTFRDQANETREALKNKIQALEAANLAGQNA